MTFHLRSSFNGAVVLYSECRAACAMRRSSTARTVPNVAIARRCILMAEYPEHEKLAAISDKSQAVGEFLDFCGYTLCEVQTHSPESGSPYLEPRWMPVTKSIPALLAEFFGIDQEAIDREKRTMLDKARAA